MVAMPLAHVSWAIADNADRKACDAWFIDLFGAQTAHEMLETPDVAHLRFDREERLMLIGDTMLIPIAPGGRGLDPDSPTGEMLRRNAGFNRWLGLALRVPDVEAAARWMAARGAKKRRSTKASAEKGPAPGLSIAAAALATQVKQAGLNREVLFVPPSMPATDLLVRMQASHTHLAIVIDEYGGTEGLVSIEDLVEVIVGDISDEHDTDEDLEVKPQEEGVYTADGRVDLSTLEERLGIDLLPEEEEEEADPLAGLIFKIAGRVPTRGEIILHDSGLEFEILDSDPRRVKRVRINARNAAASNAEPAADLSSG